MAKGSPIRDSEVLTCRAADGAVVLDEADQDWVYVWKNNDGEKVVRIGATWLHPVARTEKHFSDDSKGSFSITAFKVRKPFERARIRDLLSLNLLASEKASQSALVGNQSIADVNLDGASSEEQSYVEEIIKYLYPIKWRPPTLETERLILRGVEETDAESIFKYASDPEVTKFCFFDTHKTIADAHYFIKELAFPSYAEKIPEPFAITLKNSGELVGCCGCFVVSEEHKTMELGYIIDKPYWGQGMVVEASKAVVDFVFTNYSVERLQCRCKVENAASQRVMGKLGFRSEGVLRSALWHRERFWDMYTTSMLRSEWQILRDDQ